MSYNTKAHKTVLGTRLALHKWRTFTIISTILLLLLLRVYDAPGMIHKTVSGKMKMT